MEKYINGSGKTLFNPLNQSDIDETLPLIVPVKLKMV